MIEALSDLDKRMLQATLIGPHATTYVNDQVARMAEGIKRKQKTNAVPKSGQPPKTRGIKCKRAAAGSPGTTTPPLPDPTYAALTALLASGYGGSSIQQASQLTTELVAQFKAFLACRQGGGEGENSQTPTSYALPVVR